MAGSIFARTDGGNPIEMEERQYDSESVLQKLLAQHPYLLAGDQIDPTTPRRWLLVSNEVGLASEEAGPDRWSVDHLLLDQDGVPTIVEVKRSSDTRIRREVIGQMIEYAANAVRYWPIRTVRERFEARCRAEGKESERVLAEFVQSEQPAEQFWQKMNDNLQTGRDRLVFVADVIPSELRRAVEFLNAQMSPADVFAVEIRQYVGPALTAFVPRVYGTTAISENRKSPRATTASSPLPGVDAFESLISEAPADRQRLLRDLSAWS
ncbi:MAG: hypothetical protein FJ033_11410 [Chloroflexi bacterium]|nr:hypothetical protein [Chloroflexota bacterium]